MTNITHSHYFRHILISYCYRQDDTRSFQGSIHIAPVTSHHVRWLLKIHTHWTRKPTLNAFIYSVSLLVMSHCMRQECEVIGEPPSDESSHKTRIWSHHESSQDNTKDGAKVQYDTWLLPLCTYCRASNAYTLHVKQKQISLETIVWFCLYVVDFPTMTQTSAVAEYEQRVSGKLTRYY